MGVRDMSEHASRRLIAYQLNYSNISSTRGWPRDRNRISAGASDAGTRFVDPIQDHRPLRIRFCF